jgi:ABC-type spermidine/putrescine transport system permease subunit II
MSPAATRALLGSAVTAIILYLTFPVIVVLAISFSAGNFLVFPPPGLSLRWYRAIASDPEWMSAFIVTLKLGGLTALLATLLGVPAAFALVRYVIPAKALLGAVILCALVTPPIVTAISTYLFFVPLGLNNSIVGLACAHAVSGMPFVVINTAASLRSADRNLERAAIIHGAHPLWAIIRITLPIIAPGIIIGAILAFVHSAHELLIATFVLGGVGKPVTVKIWSDVQASSNPTIAAASSILIGLAVLTFASVAAAQALARRRSAVNDGE